MLNAEQEADAARRHKEIVGLLRSIIKQGSQIMSADTNLTAIVLELKAAVADGLADIEALLAKIQGATDDPIVVQAVADIQAQVDALKTEHAKVNPPPQPAA